MSVCQMKKTRLVVEPVEQVFSPSLLMEKETFKSETLPGSDGGENVDPAKVEFDIPTGAKELTIVIGDGGDGNGCDHSTIGDAKLLTAQALAVEPANKLPTIWGHLKESY